MLHVVNTVNDLARLPAVAGDIAIVMLHQPLAKYAIGFPVSWTDLEKVPITPGGVVIPPRVIVPLTNDDFINLPTTPIDLVAAPGAGYRLQFVQADLEVDFTGGVYTNIDADGAFLHLCDPENETWGSNYLIDDSAVPVTYFSDMFAMAIRNQVVFVPFTEDTGNGEGNMARSAGGPISANTALQLQMFNAGGILTGGDPGNHGRIIVEYRVVPVL